jgi:DNA-binding NarL/FixJ family response regulator
MPSPRRGASPLVIWIVDDDPGFLVASARILSDGGEFLVVCLSSASEILALLGSGVPDVILLDVHLRSDEMDGIALLSTIRKSGFTGRIVMLTGDASTEMLFRAALAGADDYLVKDFSLDLVGEMKRLLHGASPAKEPEAGFAAGGYLRSRKLNDKEIGLLLEIVKDYPALKELASRVGKPESLLRKEISRIYKKLEVTHYSQLARLLTILSIYGKET